MSHTDSNNPADPPNAQAHEHLLGDKVGGDQVGGDKVGGNQISIGNVGQLIISSSHPAPVSETLTARSVLTKAERTELDQLLMSVDWALLTLVRSYRASVPQRHRIDLHDIDPTTPRAVLTEMLDDIRSRLVGLRMPLFTFLERLACSTEARPIADALRTWMNACAPHFGINTAELARLRYDVAQPTQVIPPANPYLLVAIWPSLQFKGSFCFKAWLYSDQYGRCIAAPDKQLQRKMLGNAIYTLYRKVQQSGEFEDEPLTIGVSLPHKMLFDGVEAWETELSLPLGLAAPIVLRSLERTCPDLVSPREGLNEGVRHLWQTKWKAAFEKRTQPPAPRWIHQPNECTALLL
jgi:hypothetical protein